MFSMGMPLWAGRTVATIITPSIISFDESGISDGATLTTEYAINGLTFSGSGARATSTGATPVPDPAIGSGGPGLPGGQRVFPVSGAGQAFTITAAVGKVFSSFVYDFTSNSGAGVTITAKDSLGSDVSVVVVGTSGSLLVWLANQTVDCSGLNVFSVTFMQGGTSRFAIDYLRTTVA